jgi:hypothetical protein
MGRIEYTVETTCRAEFEVVYGMKTFSQTEEFRNSWYYIQQVAHAQVPFHYATFAQSARHEIVIRKQPLPAGLSVSLHVFCL